MGASGCAGIFKAAIRGYHERRDGDHRQRAFGAGRNGASGSVLQSGEESEPMAAGKFEWNPEKSASGPVSLLVNSADKTLYVYRNGVEIGRAGMPNSNPPRKDSSPFSKCRKARRFCSR